MLQKRILLIVSTIVFTCLFFTLPKVVVENDKNGLESPNLSAKASGENPNLFSQGFEIDENSLLQISRLRKTLNNSEINKKSITLADSLVILFRQQNKLDSAAKYLEWKALNFPNEENFINAGLSYYEAFGFAVDRNKLDFLGEKTRVYLNKVLENHADRLDLKAKIAMTYVSSPNPMQGIWMLREILEIDAENTEAIFSLGLLSRQSGQYEKAISYFEKLISMEKSNIRARFLLGLSHLDLNDKAPAKKHFEIITRTTSDPAVLSTVEGYLEEIN